MTFLVIVFLASGLLGTSSALAAGSTGGAGGAGPEAGVNIISVGNKYTDPQFQGKALDQFFAALKKRGVTLISLRLVWAVTEPQEGIIDTKVLDRLKRILDVAHTFEFKVMLDLHTNFKVQSYSCPKWVAHYPQDDGEPGICSTIMIARSKKIRNAYLSYIADVTKALRSCQAITVVSVLNEPHAQSWKATESRKHDIEQLESVIADAARVVRQQMPGQRVTVRFAGRDNPWSLNPYFRWDANRLFKSLDVIGLNVYLNPNDDDAKFLARETGSRLPTFSWPILATAAKSCHKAGKPLWITEFGAPYRGTYMGMKGSIALQKKHYEAFCKRFWGPEIHPDALLAWVVQPNPKHNVALNSLYDGATGTFYPAFDVYSRYMLGLEKGNHESL